MLIARRIGSLVIAGTAVVIWFVLAPNEGDHSSQAATIEVTDDLNNESTAGAAQQAVVNGWTADSYLALLSRQLDEQTTVGARDNRPAALLVLVVLALALIAFTDDDTGGAYRTATGARVAPSAASAPTDFTDEKDNDAET